MGKGCKGKQDDTKDSKWIGDLFRIGLVKSSFIPELNIRILREFLRYRYKLVSMKSSEKNRFQNAFTVCNVALDSVVSDMFGKSATAITDYLTSDESFDWIIVFPCYSAPSKRRLRKFWSPLKATPFLTSRRLASKLSVSITISLRN